MRCNFWHAAAADLLSSDDEAFQVPSIFDADVRSCLHHCLTTGKYYDEAAAFTPTARPAQDIAA